LARKIIKQTSSFGVLRANPRISGNVKITVDSSNEIWLNSIDSNPEMSDDLYKGFKINDGSSYDRDLYQFFDYGKTEPEFVFGLYGENDKVQNQIGKLSDSYDLKYSTGVTPLISDKYTEDFSYLAPFYLGEDIPDYFVIFRVDDPIDYSYKNAVSVLENKKKYKVIEDPSIDKTAIGYLPFKVKSNLTYVNGDIFEATQVNFEILQGTGSVILLDPLINLSNVENSSLHFKEKILPKSSVIATYDLTESSKIGKYIRNIKNNGEYSDELINVKFEENQITTFNGVNYSVGVFDKKGDFLLDYFKKGNTQIGFEEYITDGFKRNGIISYKLLNLEFLFSDEDADNYTVNRYYGLFVNAAEITSFKLDGNALYENRNNSGNTPLPTRNEKGYYYQDDTFYQYNKNGIRLYADYSTISGKLPTSNDVNINEDNKLFWIKDKLGNFYSLKRDLDYTLVNNPAYATYGLTGTENQLVIQNKKIDMSVLTGSDKYTRKQYKGITTGEKGRAYSVIRIENELSLSYSDSILFYNPLGNNGQAGNRYDIIRASDLSSIVEGWLPGSYYAVDDTYYFNPLGTPEEIAKSIAGIFNSFRYNSFEAFTSGNEVIIRTIAASDKENFKYSLDFYQDPFTNTRMPESRAGKIFINDIDCSAINNKQNFVGGSLHATSRVKVKLDDANKIKIGETFIETIKGSSASTSKNTPDSSNRSASVIIGKYRFVDEYAKDGNGDIIGLKDFETHATLEVSNYTEEIAYGSIESISTFDTYDIPLGIFSFYGLRELDGDFWDSQYGYTPSDEYYKYLDTQPKRSLSTDGATYVDNIGYTKIVPGKTYYVNYGVNINYGTSSITGPKIFTGQASYDSYDLVSGGTGESNVYPTLSSSYPIKDIGSPTYDPTTLSVFYPDLDAFPGFSGIQSIKFIDDLSTDIKKYDQLNFGKLYSEYEYTQDNYNKDFALKSRTNPYISKWVYRGGSDVRGNGYRLNSNLAFTPLNFSPSFFRRTQDPQYFTHEWYQLQKPPFSYPEHNLDTDKNYLAGEINESFLNNANPALKDYFLDYFSIDGESLLNLPQFGISTDIEKINLTERYTVTDYNKSSGFVETLFRGAKIRIKRAFTDYTQDAQTKYIDTDTYYDGYKFSCVIVPIKNIINEIQPPVKIKINENRTFKTITFILEVVLDEVRGFDFDLSSPGEQSIDLDYFLMYSLKDKLTKQTIGYVNSLGIIGTADVPKYGDVKLSSGLNISSTPNEIGDGSTVNIGTANGSGIIYTTENLINEYDTDLREEISLTYLPTTSQTLIGLNAPGTFYGVVGSVNTGYNFPFPTGVGENYVNFTNTNFTTYNFDFSEIGLSNLIDNIPTGANYANIRKTPIYQRQGGANYWKNILEKLSFANISLWINSGYTHTEYNTYYWDETTLSNKVLKDQFVLEFLKPSSFEQKDLVYPTEDNNKPSELSLSVIGYNISKLSGDTELYRYSGGYVPYFREILKFNNIKNDLPYWMIPTLQTFIITVEDKDLNSPVYYIGSNKCFSINGEKQNEITLIKGIQYIFDLSDSSNLGYKFYLSNTSKGDSFSTDLISQGYLLIGTPGTPGAKVIFTVPYNLEGTYYYVSQSTVIGTDGRYMGGDIKLIDPIEYSYCSFGYDKNDFGKVKNVNYYKYSDTWIYKIGKDSAYNPVYNLVGESPIDRRDLSLFESNWDPGYYRQYTNSTSYVGLPGTKNMEESKSFFGSKIMKTPEIVNSQKQLVYPTSITDVFNVNINDYNNYEILWEETNTEIRGILLIDRMTIRYFLEDGGKMTFSDFIVPEFGFGSSNDINDDFSEYMKVNVLPTYQSKNNGTYLKKVPQKDSTNLVTIKGDLEDYKKLINSYYPSQEIKYTKINELKYEFTLTKDPSYDYSLAFSIQIGKI
jgi:hypothetical protein